MISNGQRSGNRNDIAAEPMDGFSSLRCDRSKRGINAAIRPPGPIPLLLSRDTTRAANASPAMTSVDARVPRPSCPKLIPCLARWTVTSPTSPGIRHGAKPWADGMVAIGPPFRARHRHDRVPGPIPSHRQPHPPRPGFASAIAWYHSSAGVIPGESLSARIKDRAAGEPRDNRRACKKRAQR